MAMLGVCDGVTLGVCDGVTLGVCDGVTLGVSDGVMLGVLCANTLTLMARRPTALEIFNMADPFMRLGFRLRQTVYRGA
jgi:hypothetical protein